jgi:heat-inducible transcriptional repressor
MYFVSGHMPRRKPTLGPLNDRARHLLKVLVERYIRDGVPVGSRTLAEDAGGELSAATIRNVLADLEDIGYLISPHTSAGRVPTDLGYRVFVDSLLTVNPLRDQEVRNLGAELGLAESPERVVAAASALLSKFTQYAGLITLPQREAVRLRQIEFLPLTGNRVLSILVVNDHEVQNRIITTDRAYTADELKRAANYLNAHYVGHDLLHMRERLIREMSEARQDMQSIMDTVIAVAQQAFAVPTPDSDLVVQGQTNLMGCAELSDVDRLRQLFAAFNEKRDLLHVLDQCIQSQGIQIFIGGESGHRVLQQCSLVTASYQVDGRVVGVLGVIGPTRMTYQRVIPVVDLTAKLVSAALSSFQ